MGYIWPLPQGSPISQNFGQNTPSTVQFNPPGGHNGIDFAVPIGTPVRAPGNGVIQHADWVTGSYKDNPWWLINMGGIQVVLDCGEVAFVFAHLISTDLNVGDRVLAGQIIGYSGNTSGTDLNGNKITVGAHVHFECLPDGWNFGNGFYGRVNPANYCDTYWTGGDVIAPQESVVTPIPVQTSTGTENWVDLSSHNGTVDFAALKASGVAGVIFKVSEGIGWEDTTAAGYNWRTAVAKARAAGLKVGFYHFARPGAQNDPKIEADWFIRCIQPIFQPGDGVVLDWESNAAGENLRNVGWAKVWLDAVCARLSIPARDAWFYTYTAILHNGADWGLINRTYPLWHAEYGANEEQNWGPAAGRTRTPIDWPAGVAGWQYTSKGLITGTRGYTDLNAIYFTTTASEEEIMATVHDIFVQPISDKNQKQFSQFLEDTDARIQLLVDALTPGKEGVKFEGEVLKALNDLKAAVSAQAQDPAAIAKLVIDGIGAQKAEDVLIELGKLINAAVTPPAA